MVIYSDDVISADYFLRLCACVMLVLIGGLLAGLTIGYMSLDEMNLAVLATSGSPRQRQYAKRIQPLRRNGHWLLVTLLLGNTVVNETLPIVMHSILGGGGLASIAISTTLIFLFGEIIPQALCTRFGLAIGAFFACPVTVLQLVLSPLGYPIALLLDRILGAAHSSAYKKPQLKELVSLSNAANGGTLTADEVTIIRGALDLSDKLVENVMTDLENVYMVDMSSQLDRRLLTEMLRKGYSRVPVFCTDRQNIVGVLLVKSLILLDPDDCSSLTQAKIIPIPRVTVYTSLFDILNIFQNGGSHMAVVTGPPQQLRSPLACCTSRNKGYRESQAVAMPVDADALHTPHHMREQQPLLQDLGNEHNTNPGYGTNAHTAEQDSCADYAPIGIITLEDVIEELIQEEIIDETDEFVDIRKRIKVVRATNAGYQYQGINETINDQPISTAAEETAQRALDGSQDLLNKALLNHQRIQQNKEDISSKHINGNNNGVKTFAAMDHCTEQGCTKMQLFDCASLSPTATPPEVGTDTAVCSIIVDSGPASAKSPCVARSAESKSTV
ncbi:hypothetical protein IW140_003827 [Coemansia sp. RSA 1813]|nr:hypothetical protein EV178_001698 [Coemansia sp. RSA 1646]KAJ1768042.1 hypothetical protein LPJ74_005032 [Coemansia sp. RSA 1843]KAJ2090086.1 hypothetical protein IW138_002896 [Coemansia sp. RSA 986]KAJ2211409.1 hypothetical protein EV179_005501 [Coemansia sp. RSA 487]KAJ2568509.1 hypothetical protein IW140_003827 [Coemansia sp. RSA 1813]